jgi:hypothetical protein
MIMRNEEKIRKQKNSLLRNHHKIGLGLLGLVAVVVLIHAFGASFSAKERWICINIRHIMKVLA